MLIEVYNSVGGAAFFRRLLREWQTGGARVVQHQAISESDYRAVRGIFRRLVLRWRMYPGYAWICWRAASKRTGLAPIRVVTTNPFFAPALVEKMASGSGTTIHLLYDLFPEALIQAGKIEPKSWTAGRCAAITRFALQRCGVTVFLGERLRQYVETTYGPARRAVVIPVGADGEPFRNAPPRLLAVGEPPQILYSGLMGSMHDVRTLVDAWAGGICDGVSWQFNASGSGYALLRREARTTSNVTWGGSLNDAEWTVAMKRAHVALVTIAPGAERVVMPSKTYSALVAGQAVLAICRRESDLADLVLRHDCGWVVEPGDTRTLNHVLAQIAQDRDTLWTKRRNAFSAGHEYYDMGPVSALWLRLFAELENKDSLTAVDLVVADMAMKIGIN